MSSTIQRISNVFKSSPTRKEDAMKDNQQKGLLIEIFDKDSKEKNKDEGASLAEMFKAKK